MRRVIAVMLAGAVCLGALAAPAVAQDAPAAEEPAAEREGCKYGSWPADVEGKPAGLKPGAAAGVYLWHTRQGWNLAVTHENRRKYVFAGTIHSAGEIYGVERRTERRDNVVVNHRKNTLSFRFVNYGGIDGVFFKMRCAPGFGVNATLNGRKLTPEQVFIGADGHHPQGVPFRVVRVK